MTINTSYQAKINGFRYKIDDFIGVASMFALSELSYTDVKLLHEQVWELENWVRTTRFAMDQSRANSLEAKVRELEQRNKCLEIDCKLWGVQYDELEKQFFSKDTTSYIVETDNAYDVYFEMLHDDKS